MKTISIVRNRGQLTIPDSLRKSITWLNPMSAITISIVKPDEIIIKPHRAHVDQEKVWNLIRKSRNIKGKGEKPASQFIMEDRNSH